MNNITIKTLEEAIKVKKAELFELFEDYITLVGTDFENNKEEAVLFLALSELEGVNDVTCTFNDLFAQSYPENDRNEFQKYNNQLLDNWIKHIDRVYE